MSENKNESSRWEEIVEIWRTYPPLYALAGFLVGVLMFPAIFVISTDAVHLLENLVPEAFGIAFTVFLIDSLYARRARQQQIQELKEQLIREAGSPANTMALHAIKELRNHKWLEGEQGLLKGKDLMDAALQKAKLAEACLYKTDISYADLTEANLYMCDMRLANLWRANLRNAILKWADLSHATLVGADLRGANLAWCNLEGATLWGYSVNNQKLVKFDSEWDGDWERFIPDGAKSFPALFDNKTILPDGTPWTEQTDMRRFTFSEHPEFWNPQVDDQGNPIWYKPQSSKTNGEN